MLKQIQNWVRSVVVVLIVLLVIALGVYISLNAQAFWQRLNYWMGDKFDQSADEVVAAGLTRVDDVLVADSQLFPDIFMADAVKSLLSEYQARGDNFLYIPRLGIGAPIMYLDEVNEDVLRNELLQGVGHYPDTALPGQLGNSFIFGHSSYYWWSNSPYASIFANLESVQVGDYIVASYNHQVFVYQVMETKVVSPTEMSVLDQGRDYRLSLMTCTPLGTNLNRFVVVAQLVS